MTITSEKACTRCSKAQPIAAFYPRHRKRPDGARRSHCKTCTSEASRNRPPVSLRSEIANHYFDKTRPLSPEAEAVIYTSEPIPAEVLANYHKREKARKAKSAARERRLANCLPMRFARLEYAA